MFDTEQTKRALDGVLQAIPDPRLGLPDAVFEFSLKITPQVNVDLLIHDNSGRTLAAWRKDDFGVGWHIPGGIIRHRENWAHRIAEVARLELGATVDAEPAPCDVQQFFSRRGHFISLLFRCRLTGGNPGEPDRSTSASLHDGDIGWFTHPPVPIYPGHEVYSRHFF